ncbi:two-component regulator propeller domain-containing protein [uncultured Bacteroides sp.]|uniref:hybrid sensor histidine kinase/response regulator transcription factor n=1 Tax=uncultured Bacteroides sp. TaxID=162156 RepID=UPI002AA695BD|nr:two-component regulator propeller domain-containing protein [uncultured Bacteroides sp.]
MGNTLLKKYIQYFTYNLVLKGLLIFLLQGVATITRAQSTYLKFNHITTDNGLPRNLVYAINKDKFGFMWFGTWGGLVRYDGYTCKIFRANEDNPFALSNNRIDAIITDADKNIWILTGDSRYVFRFNYAKENFTRLVPAKVPSVILKKIRAYIHTKQTAENKRYSWTASTEGLIQFDKLTHSKTIYHTNVNSPFAINDNMIYAVYLDNSNNLWVGTQNGGVNVADLNGKQFKYYSVGNFDVHSNIVRAICQDKAGNLWVGTDADGVTVIDRGNTMPSFTHYGKKQLMSQCVRAIYCDRLGYIWIGTKGGLNKYDPRTKNFKHYYTNVLGGTQNSEIFKIIEDHSSDLWIGTFGGIAKYDRKSDRFLFYDSKSLLRDAHVRDILVDYRNNLWVATERGGLTCLLHSPSNEFSEKLISKHYRHINGKTNSLINDMLISLAEDEDKKLWIGTNAGLCRLDPQTGIFTPFSVATGFPDDLIMGLLTDRKGHIWVSHKQGLTCMDIRTFARRTFNRFDGLQGNEFTEACYRNPSTGEMFFGGTNGLNAFFPDRIIINSNSSKPVLTDLKIMNQPVKVGTKVSGQLVLEKSMQYMKRIVLTYENTNFSISFSSLNYNNPNNCMYKYQLIGVDKQWNYTNGSLHEAIYTHLSAGLYTFKVYAANSDGVWSAMPASVEIEILPPWWFSWMAKLLYTILVAVAIWFVYRYVRSRIEFKNKLLMEQLKNEKNEELMNMKLQFFTEISHEFRTPLTLILDPLEQLLSRNTSKEKAHYYYKLMNTNARQLLDLINQLLDFRKLQSKNLSMKYVTADIVDFVRNIASTFTLKAEEHHIHFMVQADINQINIDFDADKMRIILNNLLSNAFHFTPDYGEILVRILMNATHQNEVIIEIQDNGVGIPEEHHEKVFDVFYQVSEKQSKIQGSGLGLALTKELVLLHGGKINLISETGKGACFQIVIPSKQESVISEKQIVSEKEPINSFTEIKELNEQADIDSPLILLVDDNVDIRNYFTVNFSGKYRVITAMDGLDGFNKAIGTIPDLIVSDIMMPGIDGIELCKRLKTNEYTSHIPVILLTAKQSDESRIEGYETGADAYVIKPFNTTVLEARIANLLDQRTKLRQLFSNSSPTEFKKIAINVTDETFLNKVVSLINKNMEETDFDPDKLAECLNMSRSQLYRKIKALTNRSIHDFMTSIRMNKAKEYLLSGDYSISETAYKVGYTLPTNFTRTFTKQFGVTPSQYINEYKK